MLMDFVFDMLALLEIFSLNILSVSFNLSPVGAFNFVTFINFRSLYIVYYRLGPEICLSQ